MRFTAAKGKRLGRTLARTHAPTGGAGFAGARSLRGADRSPPRRQRKCCALIPGPGKRAGDGGAAEEEMTPAEGPAYVAAVLMLYVDLPDTPSRPSPQDQALARWWYEQQLPLPLVESALLLASLRRLVRPGDLPPLPPIRSLAYFQPVIAELRHQPLPDGYLDYLRLKLQHLGAALPSHVQKTTFSDDR